MTTRRQWLLILLIAGLGAIAGYCATNYAKPDCEAARQTAAVSKRAAEIRTGALVGCAMTFEQVRQVVSEQVEAEVCK
jgi:hypothetical protein